MTVLTFRPKNVRGAAGLASTVASLISSAERGDGPAAEALFAALYTELHRLAERQIARNRGAVTIGVTTLLHEAFLDIAAREGTEFPDEARFMGYAAKVMRGVIVDHVRNRQAQKRGGAFEITSLTGDFEMPAGDAELIGVADVLDELAKVDPELARIVDLKFFCGFSFTEISAMNGTSERTVQRRWDKARVFLHRALSRPGP